MKVLGTARLDSKSRVVLTREVREALGVLPPSKETGERGDFVLFGKDDEGRIIIKKV